MHNDAFDEALERFAATGPEFGPGLANHGPMGAEALVALGRGDAVAGWAEWYLPRLTDAPQARTRIDPQEWREAAGDVSRVGDWIAFFAVAVQEQPWPDLLDLWVGRLAPGLMGGGTHGILRTAHAVRALDRGVTPQRLMELAEGLAYWAARYQTLPASDTAPERTLSVAQAVASVPVVPDNMRRRGLIIDALKSIDGERFAPAIGLVDADGDTGAFVSAITTVFARHYLANKQRSSIAFIHTVTAPSSLRIIAPHLSPAARRSAMRYMWQACAAMYAAYGTIADPPGVSEPADFDAADLIDQAVAARDEHGIKFTEACLREYAITPDANFIAAARDAIVRLKS